VTVEGPKWECRDRGDNAWSKLSSEVAEKLGIWKSDRSGFSCFVTEQTTPEDKDGLTRLIRYLFRSPCSYRQLSYDESTGKVRCRSKRGGFRAPTSVGEWHATEFLAVLAQHMPRPRQHLVTYAGNSPMPPETLGRQRSIQRSKKMDTEDIFGPNSFRSLA